jgi:transposase, IS5 family
VTTRRHSQTSLADLWLFGAKIPPPDQLLDPQLRQVDALLHDAELVDEVVGLMRQRHPQSAGRGRGSTPAETVLRLLVLKHLRCWSYETLQWEVTGNLGYRHFCRIDAGKVPDAKTMVRYGQLLDEAFLRGVLERLVVAAKDRGVTAGRRMRVDTTVVEAPIHFPTDSALCSDVVKVISRETKKLEEAGAELPFVRADVRRSVARRLMEIGQALRRRGDARKRALKRPYRRLLRVTGRLVRQAAKAIESVQCQLKRLRGRRRRQLAQALAKLERTLPVAQRIVRQARARILRGVTNSEGKVLSLFEPYARILRRGKLHKPTEFGVLVKVQEAEGGVVTDVDLVSTHHDSGLLVPSVERHVELFGVAPRLVATDRGFFSGDGVKRIQEMGVQRAVVPHPGHRSRQRIAHERQRWFKEGRAWRAGGEARISRLKRTFGMTRSRYRGEQGMKRTVYWAAIANNLMAVARAA